MGKVKNTALHWIQGILEEAERELSKPSSTLQPYRSFNIFGSLKIGDKLDFDL